MTSVNTNVAAMAALQNLYATQSELATTQNRINTGLKVASAKDDGAIWAVAQNQRATASSLDAVKDSLNRSISTVDVALSAGTSISDLLTQMKSKALAASDVTLDTNSRTAMSQDFSSLRNQIKTAIANASFNGANMITDSASGATPPPTTVQALASADGKQSITVQAQDLSFGTSGALQSLATASLSTATVSHDLLSVIDNAIAKVSSDLGSLGTGSKALNSHLTFIGKLQDSITSGVGNLVDADLAKESAKLQSLQTKQQLGVQALSIANQSSSVVLSLFR
jgi:flagellin